MPLTISNTVTPSRNAALSNRGTPQPFKLQPPSGIFNQQNNSNPLIRNTSIAANFLANLGGGIKSLGVSGPTKQYDTMYGPNRNIPVENIPVGRRTLKSDVAYVGPAQPSAFAPTPAPTPALFTPKVANAQTTAPAPTSSVAPSAQASYRGGQAMPTVGSPEYLAAQKLGQSPTYTPPQMPVTNPSPVATGTPGLYGQSAQGLYDSVAQNAALGKNAQQIAENAGARISEIGGIGARGAAGYLTTGTSPVGEGNAAILKQTTAAQQQAVAQGANAALQGNQQALSAQGQAQSALSAAGGLAAPIQVPYNNQLLSPISGQAVNPNAGQTMQDAVSLQVQKIRNGTTDPSSAASALSAYGQAGTNALQQALGPNFNLNIASGAAGAQANVAGTQAQTIEQYKSALQQGQNLQSQLTDLITTFGLNPGDINATNKGIQLIAQNTSSPQYKILQNYVNDIANTYSQILTPPGGSQTDTTRGLAASMLDATAKGTSIVDVMKSLDAAAQAKIAGVSTLGGQQHQGGGGGLYDF